MKMKNRAYALHARPQIHTRYVQYLLLCHCNNGCTNGPQCYVIRTVYCLSCCSVQCTTLIVSALNGFLSQCSSNFVHKVVARCVVSYVCSPIAQMGYSRLRLIHTPAVRYFSRSETEPVGVTVRVAGVAICLSFNCHSRDNLVHSV